MSPPTFIHLGEPTYQKDKAEGRAPFDQRPVEERRLAKVICGHDVTCRTHLLVPGKLPHYVAFLREPGERLISLYNFEMQRRRKHGEAVIEFEDWYQDGKRQNIVLGWLYADVFGCGPARVNRTVYNEVLRRLKEFWFVGCTEHMDRDVQLLLRFMGVSGLPAKENVSGVSFPKLLEDDERLKERLNRDNALDFEMYNYWKEHLNKRVLELRQMLDAQTGQESRADSRGKGSWLRRMLGRADRRTAN